MRRGYSPGAVTLSAIVTHISSYQLLDYALAHLSEHVGRLDVTLSDLCAELDALVADVSAEPNSYCWLLLSKWLKDLLSRHKIGLGTREFPRLRSSATKRRKLANSAPITVDTPLVDTCLVEVLNTAAANGSDGACNPLYALGALSPHALSIASEAGHGRVVEAVLKHCEKFLDIDFQDERQGPALYVASRNGHVDIVTSLLAARANPNILSNYALDLRTALSTASAAGHAEVVKLLVQKGAEINAASDTSRSALLAAVANGNVAVASLLLRLGADVNLRCGNPPRDPLEMALQIGHEEMVALLLSNGANISAYSPHWLQPRHPVSMRHEAGMEALQQELLIGLSSAVPALPKKENFLLMTSECESELNRMSSEHRYPSRQEEIGMPTPQVYLNPIFPSGQPLVAQAKKRGTNAEEQLPPYGRLVSNLWPMSADDMFQDRLRAEISASRESAFGDIDNEYQSMEKLSETLEPAHLAWRRMILPCGRAVL